MASLDNNVEKLDKVVPQYGASKDDRDKVVPQHATSKDDLCIVVAEEVTVEDNLGTVVNQQVESKGDLGTEVSDQITVKDDLENVAQQVTEKDNINQDIDNSDTSSSDSIREVLDDVEAQIEKVREAVIRLNSERDGLVELLDSISFSLNTTSLSDLHKEEVILEVDRLRCRAGDVVCQVRTRRVASQVEALKGVEVEMARLVETVEREVDSGELMCKGFIAACGGEVVGKSHSCQKFEKMVLGCALEDQKLIKKRLVELLAQIGEIRTATARTEVVGGRKTDKVACDAKEEKEVPISESQ